MAAYDADYTTLNRLVRYWLQYDEYSLGQTFLIEEFTGVVRLLQPLDADGTDTNTEIQVMVSVYWFNNVLVILIILMPTGIGQKNISPCLLLKITSHRNNKEISHLPKITDYTVLKIPTTSINT